MTPSRYGSVPGALAWADQPVSVNQIGFGPSPFATISTRTASTRVTHQRLPSSERSGGAVGDPLVRVRRDDVEGRLCAGGVAELRRHFAAERIAVEVLHGAEIDLSMVWEMPPDELARLSIAQSRKYVLVEFPYRGWPQSLPAALSHLRRLGMTAMLAHPERNPEVQDRPDRLEAVVHVLASDVHGPHVRDGGFVEALRHIADDALRRYLTVDAPAAIVAGEPLPPKPS